MQINIRFSLLLVSGILSFMHSLQGKHIIGGDMSYECIHLDTGANVVNLRVTMKMYRDCSNPEGALFDRDAKIGIFEKMPDGRFRFVREILNLSYQTPIKSIDPTASNPCLLVPPGVCAEEATYIFATGNLPLLASGSYYIAYQRCCRNETISNILRPGEAGAAFTIEITAEAMRFCNSSPNFKSFPPLVICVNDPLRFDHSAIDKEGDSITYEFCAPLIAGGQDGSPGGKNTCFGVTPDPSFCLPPYQNVVFKAPLYSSLYPMGGNPIVTINPGTGMITGQPLVQGQFVVGVCIKEFRNGVLLTETRRDFQFNVAYCEPKVFAMLQADSSINNNKTYVINSCGSLDVDFVNLSTDEFYISSYKWLFDIQGTQRIYDSKNTSVNFPALGTYYGNMVLNEGTNCSDSVNIIVNIFPEIQADFSYQYDTCTAGPVAFTDLSFSGSDTIVSWSWNFSSNGNSLQQNPIFTFQTPGHKNISLNVVDINGCVDQAIYTIPYYPVPPLLIIDPSQTRGCSPLEICFTNLSAPIDTSYTIVWDFGDGTKGSSISPCHIYEKGGQFSIDLKVTSPIGCFTERNYNRLIEVSQSPVAEFNADPNPLTVFNPRLNLEDISQFSSSRQWLINETESFLQPNFQYTFRDTGIQKIQLVSIGGNGCQDTLVKYIDVEPRVSYFLPNAFTPNGDSKNDKFEGVGYTYGMQGFQLSIWDRWGSLIFETTDPNEGWNGRLSNSGETLPNGVYVYKLKYLTPRRQLIENKGFVTLVR